MSKSSSVNLLMSGQIPQSTPLPQVLGYCEHTYYCSLDDMIFFGQDCVFFLSSLEFVLDELFSNISYATLVITCWMDCLKGFWMRMCLKKEP